MSEKKYKSLENTGHESGYAWKTRNKNDKPVYIDGGSYMSSNWLRFVNCARGESEENVMVRMSGNGTYTNF